MQIMGTERERNELHALVMEIFKASQFGTDNLLSAEKCVREHDNEGLRYALVTAAGCEQKVAELTKRLLMGLRLDGEDNSDLYLAADEIPKAGQPCALSNLEREIH